MGALQASLDSIIQNATKRHKLGAAFIRRKLKERGIILTDAQVDDIESQLLHTSSDRFKINIDENELKTVNPELESGIKDLHLDLKFSEQDLEDFLSDISKKFAEIVPKMVNDSAKILLKQLKKNATSMLRERKKIKTSFEMRLAKRWRKPLKLLEMFLAIAMEAGADFNQEFREVAAQEKNYVFDVLTRLHARACQLTSEILVLLKSGHADGAHARWRSLHEITVVALFIESAGNEIAEKYLAHDAVESYKAARQFQAHNARLGFEPIDDDEFKEIRSAYEYLVNRFGEIFKTDYGWVSPLIPGKRPSFSDIEQKVGLDHFRPYYKLASHNVHANPKGIFHKLGLLPGRNVLLAGPSNVGLAEPGQGAAISLGQITAALLNTETNLDKLVILNILKMLTDEICHEFVSAETLLAEEEFKLQLDEEQAKDIVDI
jgi:hypothetical protein